MSQTSSSGAASGVRTPGSGDGNHDREQRERGLGPTGYPAEHFAERRIARARELADSLGVQVGALLDYGCGDGDALPLLRAAFPGARVFGFEPAAAPRAVARAAAGRAGVEVLDGAVLALPAEVDLVYCSGAFRRIARATRIDAMAALARTLRVGGLAFVWENSPLNPGTRLVMARSPLERDAVLIGPRELEVLQLAAGLTHVATEFHFVFPRALRFADPLETRLRGLPIGGQYVVVGRRG